MTLYGSSFCVGQPRSLMFYIDKILFKNYIKKDRGQLCLILSIQHRGGEPWRFQGGTYEKSDPHHHRDALRGVRGAD